MADPKQTFQKAFAFHQHGRFAEAQALYREVLQADASHFDSLHLLGLALIQGGAAEAGVRLIRQALAVRPDFSEARYNLGNALLTLNKPAEALEGFNRALQLNPRDAQYHFEAGNALQALKQREDAISCYDEAIRLNPNYAEAHNNRGIALKESGQPTEALVSYDTAIGLKPRYAEAHSNRGNALKDLFRLEEALACHDEAIRLRPDYAEAHYNRGNVLADLKRHDEALACYGRAVELRPEYPEAHHNRALLLLGRGRFREGFEHYGWRWRSPSFGSEPLDVGLPRWDGRSVEGEVLLWAEQGIGDEILYASMLSLIPDGRPRLTLAADKRLHAIYQRSFPDLQVIDSGTLKMPADMRFTAQAPVGDLGGLLGIDEEKLRARRYPFLRADTEKRDMFRASVGLPPGTPLVGLSWKSSNKRFGAEKSLRLLDLAPVLRLPGRTFINLQYGDVTDEIGHARAMTEADIHQVDGLDVFQDIDGLLALIAACDIVVTTSNVTAHLAGSIGKRTLVLVPAAKGLLWYWQGGSNDLWYPSVTRAPQARVGDWGPVVTKASEWVKEYT